MMITNARLLGLLLLVPCSAIVVGCSEPIADELAIDDAVDADDSKADANGTYTYYFVEQDMRKCISPICGGVYYRLANAGSTRCLDGTKQERCYAASLDWVRSDLDESGMAKINAGVGELLVRAIVRRRDWGADFGLWPELRPAEAWPGQLPVVHDGVLVKIEDTGVLCKTYPCASFRERKLNSSLRADLGDLGWDESGATDEQIGEALDQMHSTGLIISGDRFRVTGPAGSAKARSVTQFWLRATNESCPVIDCAAPPPGCHYEGMISSPCDQQTCGSLVCENPDL